MGPGLPWYYENDLLVKGHASFSCYMNDHEPLRDIRAGA